MSSLNIETKTGTIQKNISEIFSFLSNMNNFKGLVQDQHIKNWQSTEQYCTFDVEGAGNVGFIISEKVPNERISYKNYGNVPFDYLLTVYMNPKGENETEIKLQFEADVNPVIKMMIKKPLENLLNTIIEKLDTIKI
jgi:carbon monoxide dehydrogenase subunit G